MLFDHADATTVPKAGTWARTQHKLWRIHSALDLPSEPLTSEAFTTADVLALYRLRWRIELAFKRLKSLIGLKGPPGTDERSAKPYLLAHLLMILLLEPLIDEFERFSPLGTCRLTRPGAWRLLCQLVTTLRQAIIPQPTIDRLRSSKPALHRHLHEPPRRRSYQKMTRIF